MFTRFVRLFAAVTIGVLSAQVHVTSTALAATCDVGTPLPITAKPKPANNLSSAENAALDAKIAEQSTRISQNPTDAAGYWERAQSRAEKGAHDGAIADFTRLIELQPNNSAAHNNRGLRYELKKEYEKAIVDYTRSIELDPTWVQGYRNRASNYEDLGQHDRALADYSKAIELEPNKASFWRARGIFQANRGRNDDAISDLTKAIELNSIDSYALGRRGIAFSDNGRHARALLDHDQSVSVDPKDAWARLMRGRMHRERGNADLAVADFNAAIDLDSSYQYAYSHRASLYSDQRKHDLAIDDLTKAIELDPKNRHYFERRGDSWTAIGEAACMQRDYTRAVELTEFPFSLFVRLDRLINHVKLGAYRGALPDAALLAGLVFAGIVVFSIIESLAKRIARALGSGISVAWARLASGSGRGGSQPTDAAAIAAPIAPLPAAPVQSVTEQVAPSPTTKRSSMSALKTAAWVAVGVACLHGYIFLQTEEVHPCKAASKRLVQDYGFAAIGVGMEAMFGGLMGQQMKPSSPEGREIMAKGQTLDKFGVLGCYAPAVLGWKAIPPYR